MPWAVHAEGQGHRGVMLTECMRATQEYRDCLPPDVAADPGGRLGAWLYSCVGVSHAEEAALQGLPGLTLQAR